MSPYIELRTNGYIRELYEQNNEVHDGSFMERLTVNQGHQMNSARHPWKFKCRVSLI